MRTCQWLLLVATSSVVAPAFAVDTDPAAVTVEFVNAEKFTDANDRRMKTAPEKNSHLQSLRRHVVARASRYLAQGQTLEIRFTDIDLAGDFRPNIEPALSDVRLVTQLYPPRLKLSYEIRDTSGSTIRSGDADLRDLAFMTSSAGNISDVLRYEKRMLDRWMRNEFGKS